MKIEFFNDAPLNHKTVSPWMTFKLLGIDFIQISSRIQFFLPFTDCSSIDREEVVTMQFNLLLNDTVEVFM